MRIETGVSFYGICVASAEAMTFVVTRTSKIKPGDCLSIVTMQPRKRARKNYLSSQTTSQPVCIDKRIDVPFFLEGLLCNR